MIRDTCIIIHDDDNNINAINNIRNTRPTDLKGGNVRTEKTLYTYMQKMGTK